MLCPPRTSSSRHGQGLVLTCKSILGLMAVWAGCFALPTSQRGQSSSFPCHHANQPSRTICPLAPPPQKKVTPKVSSHLPTAEEIAAEKKAAEEEGSG